MAITTFVHPNEGFQLTSALNKQPPKICSVQCWVVLENVLVDIACRTGGLEGPARYMSAHAKCENECEASSQNNFSGLELHARAHVSRRPANPPVLQAMVGKTA